VLVVRPDSGEPASIVLKTVAGLEEAFGATVNAKGFRVLTGVRVIQGDGITLRSIRTILTTLKANGYSADNVAFGQGGALLQIVNRDDQRFAMKCSAVRINGIWRDVFKDPVTDPGKRSKAGRLMLLERRGAYRTVRVDALEADPREGEGWQCALRPVFEDGRPLVDDGFTEVRRRAEAAAEGYEVGLLSSAP